MWWCFSRTSKVQGTDLVQVGAVLTGSAQDSPVADREHVANLVVRESRHPARIVVVALQHAHDSLSFRPRASEHTHISSQMLAALLTYAGHRVLSSDRMLGGVAEILGRALGSIKVGRQASGELGAQLSRNREELERANLEVRHVALHVVADAEREARHAVVQVCKVVGLAGLERWLYEWLAVVALRSDRMNQEQATNPLTHTPVGLQIQIYLAQRVSETERASGIGERVDGSRRHQSDAEHKVGHSHKHRHRAVVERSVRKRRRTIGNRRAASGS